MKTMIEYNEAIKLILSNINKANSKQIKSIYDLDNDILAKDIKAFRDAPAFDNSAMDGYAIDSDDDSQEFKCIFSIFAGDNDEYEIKKGQCAKIMTGAKMPKGANCIVPFEDVVSSENDIVKLPKLSNGDNCRKQGIEFKKGDDLLEEGSLLDGINISLLAGNGQSFIPIFTKPKIAIISTGEEIIEPWNNAGEFGIYNSNSIAIKAILQDNGFIAEYKGVFPDNLEKLTEFIKSLKQYDFIISTGGISMGEADFIKQAYETNNMKAIFHKLNLKPGKPLMFGLMDKANIFALPGNPMSTILSIYHFVLPAIRKFSGYKKYFHESITLTNKNTFKVAKYKANIVLGIMKGNTFEAVNNNKYNSGMISPIKEANVMAVFDSKIDSVAKDETIKVLPFKANDLTASIEYFNSL